MSGEPAEHSYESRHSACQATHMALYQVYARRAWLAPSDDTCIAGRVTFRNVLLHQFGRSSTPPPRGCVRDRGEVRASWADVNPGYATQASTERKPGCWKRMRIVMISLGRTRVARRRRRSCATCSRSQSGSNACQNASTEQYTSSIVMDNASRLRTVRLLETASYPGRSHFIYPVLTLLY